MNKTLKAFLLVTDLGFILYWTITGLGLIPDEFLFKDYHNPILMSWNWSFLPLDLLASFTGLAAVFTLRHYPELGKKLLRLSLTFTFCAGFMALSFWTIRQDFDLMWWGANGFLTLWPLIFFFRRSV